jgi:steroid 5-alpha reductase family enzyme
VGGAGMKASRRVSMAACAAVYVVAAAAALLLVDRIGSARPVFSAAAADLLATLVVFAGSMLLNNSSVYDPYWSVAPAFIAVYWFFLGRLVVNPLRAVALFAVLDVWAARLTFNWARRWRGLRHEDWRYRDFRSRGLPVYWIVSFLGFHFFPTVLVFLGCLSTYPALVSPALPFRALDAAAVLVCGMAIWIEARADAELRAFNGSSRKPDEILVTGLWSLSRHPNYFGEVLFWWGLYLFGLASNPAYWWTFVGPLSITLLFLLVSVPMMDRHMAAGHPGYAERQRARSALVPWFRRRLGA